MSCPLIATSNPHKQESCGGLNTSQQEEVQVHLAIVDVPWGKKRLTFGSGQGSPGAGSRSSVAGRWDLKTLGR